MRIDMPWRWGAVAVTGAVLVAVGWSRDNSMTDETAGSADAFVNSIGSNAHLSYTDRPYYTAFSTVVLPRLRELGMRHLRINAPVLPDDRWMRQVYDNANTLYHELGITYDIIVAPLSRPGADSSTVPFGRLFQFLDPASVDMVEGLNEPDYPDKYPDWVAQTVAWQQRVYTAVKADPALAGRPMLGPALVHGAKSAMAIGSMTTFADFANMHPYPGGREPSASLAINANAYRPMNGSLPYVVTETGYHTAVSATQGQPGVSEAAMGKYIPRLFLEYWNFGIRRTYTYELIDEGTNPTDAELSFGLIHADGSPKLAFTALKNLIGLLSDPAGKGRSFTPGTLRYVLAGAPQTVHHTLLEKTDGRFYLVCWQEVPSYDEKAKTDIAVPTVAARVTFDHSMRDVKMYVPLQGTAPTADLQGTTMVSISVPDHPLVLEIRP